MNTQFEQLAPEYESLLRQMRITRSEEALAVAAHLLKTKAMYVEASVKTGVPLVWLMAINQRESSGRLDTYLGDGEHVIGAAAEAAHLHTHMTPRGRGPFPTWTAGAIDALDYMHLAGIPHWTWARALFEGELWNGFGYRHFGRHSAYLWAGTSVYQGGKFASDGVWSPGLWDTQLGLVPIMMALVKLDQSLDLEGGFPQGIPAPQPAPVELSGMQHGMSWLQDALNHVDNAGLIVDGSYGRATAAAVKAFQAKHELVVDGLAGPLTIAALEATLAGPVIVQGSQEAAPAVSVPTQAQLLPAGLLSISELPLYPIYDHDLALLCKGIYAYSGDTPVAWDHLDEGHDDCVCYGVKRIGDVDVVVLRGSTTLDDWVDDAEALAVQMPVSGLYVHKGFSEGLDKVCTEVLARNPKHIIVTGHSLGAARAAILSAALKHAGKLPLARVGFGEPKPGYPALADYLKDIPFRNYRNGRGIRGDLVTGLPFSASFMPWTSSGAFTEVSMAPRPGDLWGPFAWHHIDLYCDALAAINTGTEPPKEN